LLIKYIKSVLWRVAKRLSYIEEARCLKVKMRFSWEVWLCGKVESLVPGCFWVGRGVGVLWVLWGRQRFYLPSVDSVVLMALPVTAQPDWTLCHHTNSQPTFQRCGKQMPYKYVYRYQSLKISLALAYLYPKYVYSSKFAQFASYVSSEDLTAGFVQTVVFWLFTLCKITFLWRFGRTF
jgi:hypothetical protein